ncbi:hypothetical protein Leryth_024472 [Lithospermum erythrorhizon]|nr:hypothetical protein Leryth_024472 [Lithospermum erythrorhizon]
MLNLKGVLSHLTLHHQNCLVLFHTSHLLQSIHYHYDSLHHLPHSPHHMHYLHHSPYFIS